MTLYVSIVSSTGLAYCAGATIDGCVSAGWCVLLALEGRLVCQPDQHHDHLGEAGSEDHDLVEGADLPHELVQAGASNHVDIVDAAFNFYWYGEVGDACVL